MNPHARQTAPPLQRYPSRQSLRAVACSARRQGRTWRITLLATFCLFLAARIVTAQKPEPATPPGNSDFLPEIGVAGGPFLFERGTIRPTYMDAFNTRPVVKSPDGRLGVTVAGPKASYGAWVTIDPSAFPDGPVQVWPLQASADVLWRADSEAIALTDNRYANSSYVLVFGVFFRMGEANEGLGIPVTDLTPTVEKAFDEDANKYYAGRNYETRLFYAMVLRWTENDQLLVGVSAQTAGPATLPDRGVKEWNIAYLVDVPSKKVMAEISEAQLLSQYGVKVSK